MVKTHIVETVEEFDDIGKLLKRTVTETDETDDDPTRYTHTTYPYIPPYIPPYTYGTPYCSTSKDD